MTLYGFGSGATLWRRAAVLLVLAVVAPLSWGQNAIEAVSSSIQSGVEVVRIDLTKALDAAPPGFAIQEPARIAFDFPGVTNAMGRATVEASQGNVKSISVVQVGARSRVVLNLKQASAYHAELQGKSLLVILDAPPASLSSMAEPSMFAER